MAVSARRRRLAGTVGFAGLTVGLVLLAAFPWATWLGYASETEAAAMRAAANRWLIGSLSILTFALLLAAVGRERLDARLDAWIQPARALPARYYAWALALFAALAAVALSELLFQRKPDMVDTVAQLFQARIFAGGSLTAPAPSPPEFFAGQHLVIYEGRWFSQYPPGHSALLAVGLLIGAPWLVSSAIAAATLILVYGTARRLLGEAGAKLAGFLYLISPFALFMGASYLSHLTAGLFLAFALYALVRSFDGAGPTWPLMMGLGLGVAATIRPLEALAWSIVLGAWLLLRSGWRQALPAAAACLVAVTPLLFYNALTTGQPLRFGYTLLWGPGHGLGFHTDPWGVPFTPIKSFAVSTLDLQRLNAILFQWPLPSLSFLLVAIGLAAFDRRLRERSGPLLALFLAAPVAYFFYWHRDSHLGPRFLFASIVPAVLLSALGILALDGRLGRWRGALRVAVVAAVAFGLAINLPRSAGDLAGRLPGMKNDPVGDPQLSELDSALVLVKVGWGNRLISRLWSWGIQAAQAEQAHRSIDGCRLQLALDEADSLAAAGRDSTSVRRDLSARLRHWDSLDLSLVHGRWPEPSVRFDTTRALAATCEAEVLADARGYTLYGNLIWRNDPWLRGGVVYARSFGPQRDTRLLKRYGGREWFLYAPLTGEAGARPVLRSYSSTEDGTQPVRRSRSSDAASELE